MDLRIDKVNYNLAPIKAMKKKGDLMDHPSYQRYPVEHLELLWEHAHPQKKTAVKVDSLPDKEAPEAKDATINEEEGD
jgi:hypothetical protein